VDKIVLVQEGDFVAAITPLDKSAEDLSATIPNSKVIAVADLPSREFRDAWTVDGKIDLSKAKKIWQNKIRVARNKKLKELDVLWMKAMERGETKKAGSIAAQKAVLRDLPEREEFMNAKSLEEMKSFWPEILG